MAVVWATAICAALPAPPTPSNVRALNAWIACEKPPGRPGQWNNPLNTKEPGFGGTDALSNGVKQYPSPVAGIRATVATLRNGYYPAILSALHGGRLASAILSDSRVQSNLSTWGTGATCPASRLGGSVPREVSPGSTDGSGVSTSVGVGQTLTSSVAGATVLGLGGMLLLLAAVGVGGYLLWKGTRHA